MSTQKQLSRTTGTERMFKEEAGVILNLLGFHQSIYQLDR